VRRQVQVQMQRRCLERTRWWRAGPLLGLVLLLGSVAVLGSLAGCSLLSLKSPERPLSARDLNARILTRELAGQFIAAVGRSASDIAGTESDPAILDNSLRWEIAAVAETRRAETQIAPLMSLLDTWALAAQLQAFLGEGGAGAALFGTHQGAVRGVTDEFAAGAEALARQLLAPGELSAYQNFVAGFVREYPLRDLSFARPSVVELWSHAQGATTPLVDSLGTIPEAMSDMAQRLQIYGETTPGQIIGRTQLALRESGYAQGDVKAQLRRLDEQLERLSVVAESTPGMMQGAVTELRRSVRDVLDRLDASERATAQTLRTERTALFADIQTERQAIVAALDVQRQALAADAARIAAQGVKSAGEQLRYLAGEVLGLLIVLAVLMLGLPFAAGYLLGRARHRPAAS
jgi:hypothetical protein